MPGCKPQRGTVNGLKAAAKPSRMRAPARSQLMKAYRTLRPKPTAPAPGMATGGGSASPRTKRMRPGLRRCGPCGAAGRAWATALSPGKPPGRCRRHWRACAISAARQPSSARIAAACCENSTTSARHACAAAPDMALTCATWLTCRKSKPCCGGWRRHRSRPCQTSRATPMRWPPCAGRFASSPKAHPARIVLTDILPAALPSYASLRSRR